MEKMSEEEAKKHEAQKLLTNTIAGVEELKTLLDKAIENLKLSDSQIIAFCKFVPSGEEVLRLYEVMQKANTRGQKRRRFYNFNTFVSDSLRALKIREKSRTRSTKHS